MPQMPVLPALKTAQGNPGPLTDLLDALSEEQMVELYESAIDWSDAGGAPITDDPDAEATPDDDAPADEPLPIDNAVEHAESLEDEAAESPEQQEQEAEDGEEDFDALLEQVSALSEQADGIPDQFETLKDQAKENEEQGGDPKAVESCADEAQGYLDEIEDLQKDAEKAAKDEDADGIAEAGLLIQEKLQIVQTLLDQAAHHAATNAPAEPEPKKGPDGEELPVDKTPALTLWAQRYGKTG